MNPPASPAEWTLYALAVFGALSAGMHLAGWARRFWSKRARPPAVSFLVLVRNRQDQIEGVLRGLTALLAGTSFLDADLVVVDHGSTDHTAQVVERLAGHHAGLRLLRLHDAVCRGQGPCEFGLFACQSRVVVCLNMMGAGGGDELLCTVTHLLGAD